MKHLGEAAYILGIRIYRDRSRRLLGLSQSTYIDKVLKRFSMEDSKREIFSCHMEYISPRLCVQRHKMREIGWVEHHMPWLLARSCMPCYVQDLISHMLWAYVVDIRLIKVRYTRLQRTTFLSTWEGLKRYSWYMEKESIPWRGSRMLVFSLTMMISSHSQDSFFA